MIIEHPLLGPRDIHEFVYVGDASLLNRPKWDSEDAEHKFYEYMYLRKNPAGIHQELWFHQQGDRSWLVVSRNTLTHKIVKVDMVSNIVKEMNL
jgi:heterotetrameric sarcosine oxidase delta subunit